MIVHRADRNPHGGAAPFSKIGLDSPAPQRRQGPRVPIYPPLTYDAPVRLAAVRNAVSRLDAAHAESERRAHASTLITPVLKRLDPRDRGPVAQRFSALLRHHRRVDFALGSHARSPDARSLGPEVMDGTLSIREATALYPEIDWARVADWRARLPADARVSFAIEASLPTWVAMRWDRALAEAMLEPPPSTIRANALKIDRDTLAARMEDRAPRPAPHTTHGLVLEKPGALWNTAVFEEGLFEAQDAGSQIIAELVAPPPGGKVLDACAGAGGKTLAIAAQMKGKGRVVATDVSAEKLDALRDRARRAGANNVQVVSHEITQTFDRILVDAPCTGSGTWRRNPEAKIHSAPDDVPRMAALQLDIASRAVPLVEPGGRLIYATCSLFPEENEAIVAALRERFPELEPVRIAEIFGKAWAEPLVDATGCALALRPDRHGTDGFYAAVLRRKRG